MGFELGRYIDIIHPKRYKEAIPRLAKVEDDRMSAVHITLSVLISLAASVAVFMLVMRQMGDYGPEVQASMASLLASEQKMFLTPAGLAFTFVTSMLSSFIGLWVFYGACRALGGTGRLGNQLYVTSMLMLSFGAIYAPIMLLNMVPFVGIVASLCGVALVLYVLYLYYAIAHAVHPNLDNVRAAAAVIVWLIGSSVIGMLVFFARSAIGM